MCNLDFLGGLAADCLLCGILILLDRPCNYLQYQNASPVFLP